MRRGEMWCRWCSKVRELLPAEGKASWRRWLWSCLVRSREDSSISNDGVNPPGGGDSHANLGHQGTHTLTHLAETWSVQGKREEKGRSGPNHDWLISCICLTHWRFQIEPSKSARKAMHSSLSRRGGNAGSWPPAWLSTQRITEFLDNQGPPSILLLAQGALAGPLGGSVQPPRLLTHVLLPPSASTTSLLPNPFLKSGCHSSTPTHIFVLRHLHQLKQRGWAILIEENHSKALRGTEVPTHWSFCEPRPHPLGLSWLSLSSDHSNPSSTPSSCVTLDRPPKYLWDSVSSSEKWGEQPAQLLCRDQMGEIKVKAQDT